LSSETRSNKIVVYDLRSEQTKNIKHSQFAAEVERIRIWATMKFHRLGVMSTESVILVAPEMESEIEATIQQIKERYQQLERKLMENGLVLSFMPLIRVIELTANQIDAFREVAQRNLLSRIDATLERVNDILETIDSITEQERRRKLRYQLNRLSRTWNTIRDFCVSLGINVTRDIDYLIEIIDQARERLE